MEPFCSLAFKDLNLIFATTTNITTNDCFAQARATGFMAVAAPSYSSGHGARLDGRVWIVRFSAIHFRG